MVRVDVVTAKLVELADRIARVRGRVPDTVEKLAADRDALDLVAFNLMLAVQSCLDIASHLIADEGWPPAPTLGATFERLHEKGVIERATAVALGRAAGLRNVVAHGYAGVDPEAVYAAATRGAADLERFASEIAAWLIPVGGHEGR